MPRRSVTVPTTIAGRVPPENWIGGRVVGSYLSAGIVLVMSVQAASESSRVV